MFKPTLNLFMSKTTNKQYKQYSWFYTRWRRSRHGQWNEAEEEDEAEDNMAATMKLWIV